MRLIGGIDPGVSGGLALISADGTRLVSAWKMPVLRAEGKKGRSVIDLSRICGIFTDWILQGCSLVVVESVRSMPRDGHVGAFAFGRNFGNLEGALAGCGLASLAVSPQRWKKRLGLTADKDHSRALASRYWPEGGRTFWPLKSHDGLAEAALLALYGAKHHG